MKAILQFNLDNEEDEIKFKEMTSENHSKLQAAMWSFSQEVLRSYRKYSIEGAQLELEGVTPEDAATQMAVHIETKFYEYLSEYEAKLD